MAFRFDGKVALVTGGAMGIGKGICEVLGSLGATVVISDIADAAAEQTVAELEAAGVKASFIHHDVAHAADWARAVERVLADHGRLDVLVNNAGIYKRVSLEQIDSALFERFVAVDFASVLHGMQACAAALKAAKGCVVNIASIAGRLGGMGNPLYHAAKAAVLGLSRDMAATWIKEGVRVNSVLPGGIASMIYGVQVPPGTPLPRAPLGVIGVPADIGFAVAYLASDQARYVVGAELQVDGGFVCI